MDASAVTLPAAELLPALNGPTPPLVIDVRRDVDYRGSVGTISGALRRDPERVADWVPELPRARAIVVYCAHGGKVSRAVAQALSAGGLDARILDQGIEGWAGTGGALDAKPAGAHTRWVTRERPKIDRIACPWLIRRFVDPGAEFLYVPAADVRGAAAEHHAVPYDIPDVRFSHAGERCSFDAFLAHYRLAEPALDRLALIVRGADTARLDLAPQAAGLAAISLGLSRNVRDDLALLEQGMVIYDALYTWCKDGQDEIHTWNPAMYR